MKNIMEFLKPEDFKLLSNPGVVSEQLLSLHNSTSTRVTITRVTLQPGATQPTHSHATSEQIWVALHGAGTLLLGEGKTGEIKQGEVVRFADGDLHGVRNSSAEPFVYLSVTSPPIDFSYVYKGR